MTLKNLPEAAKVVLGRTRAETQVSRLSVHFTSPFLLLLHNYFLFLLGHFLLLISFQLSLRNNLQNESYMYVRYKLDVSMQHVCVVN